MQKSPTLEALRATLRPNAIRAELRRRAMPITTNAELLQYVEETFGVRIPQVRCCAGHQTPAEAFCNSYFARTAVTVWNACAKTRPF